MDHTILLKIIEGAPCGLKSMNVRSAYQKETGEMVPLGDEEKALVQMREERLIKFITEPWKDTCWIVVHNHKDDSDYPKVECNLFW